MLPYLGDHFGNPSNVHLYGLEANAAVTNSRQQVADLLGASPDEIVFTGGGSEASNLAIKGTILRGDVRDSHIIISSVEHPATSVPCEYLKSLRLRGHRSAGRSLRHGRPGRRSRGDHAAARSSSASCTRTTRSARSTRSRRSAALVRERGVLLHTDVAQSLGKVAVKVDELGVDLLTVAGHKLYAPKGIGVLYIRRGVEPR